MIVSIGKESIPSVSEIKAFIEKRADPGEHIRYYYKSPLGKESVHSVAYLASDADGFYFLSESGDGLKVSVLYTTYSYFHSILRIKSGDSTLKIYDTNGSSVTSGSSASVSTKAETLVSTAKPTPRYKPDTSEYKVSYTRSLLQRDWMTTMSGGDVQYMQACLYYLGYDIEIDGFYGVASASVVKQFQKHYGLTVDGDIGPSTWPAIEKAVANNPNPNALTITAHPQSVTAYSDAQVKFSVTAKGSGLKYQWQYKKAGQSEWTLWSGHTTASTSATANSTWNGMQVRCRVTDSFGNKAYSKAATVTIVLELKITAQPQNKTVSLGNSITVSVKAQGTGLSYQWYYKKTGESAWSTWIGRTGATESVTPNATWNGIQLYCQIKDSYGKTVKSNVATVTVTDPAPKITQQPQNKTVYLGESITVSVKAQGTGLSYQWYFRKKGESVWSAWKTRTHASESVTPNATWNGIQLYCRVKNSDGNTVNSETAVITVKEPPITITQHPQSKAIDLGQSITLSVKAQGAGLSYQWYFKKRGTTAWCLWNTRTHATEVVTPNMTWDGIQLYCLVKEPSGYSVKSNIAVVSVTDNSVRILQQPQSASISLGDTLTVSVKAQGTGLSYQWYFKKRKATEWSLWYGRTRATESVTPNETWDGIQLYCRVTDSSGNVVKSDVAIIIVN